MFIIFVPAHPRVVNLSGKCGVSWELFVVTQHPLQDARSCQALLLKMNLPVEDMASKTGGDSFSAIGSEEELLEAGQMESNILRDSFGTNSGDGQPLIVADPVVEAVFQSAVYLS